jgi:hypothetical protein
MKRASWILFDGSIDYPEETANHSVNEALYLHGKNWETER